MLRTWPSCGQVTWLPSTISVWRRFMYVYELIRMNEERMADEPFEALPLGELSSQENAMASGDWKAIRSLCL